MSYHYVFHFRPSDCCCLFKVRRHVFWFINGWCCEIVGLCFELLKRLSYNTHLTYCDCKDNKKFQRVQESNPGTFKRELPATTARPGSI